MRVSRVLLSFLVVSVGLACVGSTRVSGQNSLTIMTDKGPVAGYQDGSGVDKWKGVPYASPPVGDLRFAMPQDMQPWTDVLQTTTPGPICPQIKVLGTWLGKEDCLYADIYAPTNRNLSEPLPVLLWIYGGGWQFGDGVEFGLYDGTHLVSRYDYLVVSFNYRLGPLGFLALPELKQENAAGSVGSYGLYDQQQMMRWVQTNIVAFGGDPTKVTIAGESAGAFSTCTHLTSPLASGLFRSAIMESGTCMSDIFFVDQADSFAWSQDFIQNVGCDPNDADNVLTCIRALDLDDVMSSGNLNYTRYRPLMAPDMSWGATIDGVLLTDTPYNIIQQGGAHQVPVLAGTNLHEGSLFVTSMVDIVPAVHTPLQFGDMDLLIDHFFGGNETVIQLVDTAYPSSAFPNATAQISQMLRDFFFLCPTSRALLGLNYYNPNSTFMYQFVYQGDWVEDHVIGSDYHTAELEFVWDNAWPPIVHTFSARDQTMAYTFGHFYRNFIYTGTPNDVNADVAWPVYESTQKQNMVLDVPTSLNTNLMEGKCRMWDQIAQWAPAPSPALAKKASPARHQAEASIMLE